MKMVFPNSLKDFEDDLLTAKDDVLTPIKALMRGQQRAIYDDIITFRGVEAANYAEQPIEALAPVKALVDSLTPFCGNGLCAAKTAVAELRSQIAAKLAAEQLTALATLTTLEKAQWVKRLIAATDGAPDDYAVVQQLAREVAARNPFDTVDVLGVPGAALSYTNGDPIRNSIIAANDRDIDAQGNLIKLRDNDRTAGMVGALVGAPHGIEAFPDDWVRDVLAANKTVCEVDIDAYTQALFHTGQMCYAILLMQ